VLMTALTLSATLYSEAKSGSIQTFVRHRPSQVIKGECECKVKA
jgi:hypothetical protein